MPEYLSPGVYVEEVDTGPKPIEGVGTAMPAFVGFSEKAETLEVIDGEDVPVGLLNRATLVTNWSQYVERFGGFVDGAFMPQAVYGYFHNGGNRCYVTSVKTIGAAEAKLLGSDGKEFLIARSIKAGYIGQNLRVKIDTPGSNGAAASTPPAKKEAKAKAGDEKDAPPSDPPKSSGGGGDNQPFTVTVEKQSVTGAWRTQEVVAGVTLKEVKDEQGTQLVDVVYPNGKRPELVELLAPKQQAAMAKVWPRTQQQSLQMPAEQLSGATSQEFRGDVAERSGLEGLEALDDVTIVCVPDLMSTPPKEKLNLDMVKAVQIAIIGHCEKMGDRVAILDAPPEMNPQAIRKWRLDTAGYDSSYAALYYPWIQVDDPLNNRPMLVPPSGHVAGIWARSDNTRGVHKAPANEVIQGATGLAVNVTKGEQDTLNPEGVNCIRTFPGMGIRIWGARTLTSNPSWRYINVRRLFNYVGKSIERGTQWVVFEPNDMMLWARVRRDVSAFLSTVWSDGALFGASPSDAYFVKCDEELNPPASRDLGRLIVEIGIAPVKPAEFVIFRISQWAGPNAEV